MAAADVASPLAYAGPEFSRSPLKGCRGFGRVLGIQPWMVALKEHERKRKEETAPLPLIFERPWQRMERRERQRKESKGDKVMRRFWEALEELARQGYRRTPTQNKMIKAYLAACQRVVYREEFYDNVTEILKKLGVSELKQEVFVTAIRRCGKTYGVAMTVAALLYAVPSVEISIFSPGKRASKKLLQTIKRFVELLPGIDTAERSSNEETLWIRGPHGPLDIRLCNSYPSKVQIESFLPLSRTPPPGLSLLLPPPAHPLPFGVCVHNT